MCIEVPKYQMLAANILRQESKKFSGIFCIIYAFVDYCKEIAIDYYLQNVVLKLLFPLKITNSSVTINSYVFNAGKTFTFFFGGLVMKLMSVYDERICIKY